MKDQQRQLCHYEAVDSRLGEVKAWDMCERRMWSVDDLVGGGLQLTPDTEKPHLLFDLGAKALKLLLCFHSCFSGFFDPPLKIYEIFPCFMYLYKSL